MADGEVKGYFRDKLKEITVHVCTVIADTILLGVWLVGEYCFEHYLVPKFPVHTPIATAALWVFRGLFACSTLIPCASKVYKHVRIVLLRDSAAIRQVKDEVSAERQTDSAGGTGAQ
jgi:hypothetical protein